MKLEFLRGYNRKKTVEIFVANDVCLLGVLFYETVLHHISTQRNGETEEDWKYDAQGSLFDEIRISITLVF